MPKAMPENTWHVTPNGDLHPHTDTAECPCVPRIEYMDNGALVVHNSWDERELLEYTESIER